LFLVPGQVRQKRAAIRALEEEREQCIDLERRLQNEMRCGRRTVTAAAATEDSGTADGDSDDGGKMLNERRHRRRRDYASDDEREVSWFSRICPSLCLSVCLSVCPVRAPRVDSGAVIIGPTPFPDRR